jgi:hypothetical protein
MKRRPPPKKPAYKEGTWFAVALKEGCYAVGRIARYAPKAKVLLAYLFGPKREQIPKLSEIEHLASHDAIRVIKVSDLGLYDGSWPVIGDSAYWERERWPIPPFIRKDELTLSAWRETYSDDNLETVVSEQRIPYESTGLETAGFYGSGAAEYVLSKLLMG